MSRRRVSRALLIALALSLGAHLALVVGPGWGIADLLDGPPSRIDVTLAPAPVPREPTMAAALESAPAVAAPVPKPKPRRKAKPRPATPSVPAAALGTEPPVVAAAGSTVAAATETAVAPSEVPAEKSPEAPAESVQAAEEPKETSEPATTGKAAESGGSAAQSTDRDDLPSLPRTAQIEFSLILADLPVGRAVETWQQEGSQYSLRIVMETTGAARLFKAMTITQSSSGALDAQGLRPQTFRYEQTGRATADSTFDWQQMKLRLEQGEKRREFPLDDGAQDILSLAYQLGYAQAMRQTGISVATGKSFSHYTLEWMGEEVVNTAAGAVRALHVRTVEQGDQSTEIWIAPQLRNLPVRIKFTDRGGTSTQLIADHVEADGASLLRAPGQ